MVKVGEYELGPFYLEGVARDGLRRRGVVRGFAVFERRSGWGVVGGWIVDGNWAPRVEGSRVYGVTEVADVDVDSESFLLKGGTLMGIILDEGVALVGRLTRDLGSDLRLLKVNVGSLGYYIYDGVRRLGRVAREEWCLDAVRRVLR